MLSGSRITVLCAGRAESRTVGSQLARSPYLEKGKAYQRDTLTGQRDTPLSPGSTTHRARHFCLFCLSGLLGTFALEFRYRQWT